MFINCREVANKKTEDERQEAEAWREMGGHGLKREQGWGTWVAQSVELRS